jgi:ribosome-associated heat shock protein Hsp15
MSEARIDKWMWAVRIFKTRTIAAEACKKGRISINGALAKAARMVKPGDVIQVRKPPVTYSFKVLQSIEKRVGAKLVPEMMENVTTPDQYELLEMSKVSGFINRAKGTPKRIAANWKILPRRNLWMTLILISTLKNNIISV